MPCSNQKARKLLKNHKAKIIYYHPFTIQLNIPTGESTQECLVGIDTGCKMVGVAITCENKILMKGEIELRQDVSSNITDRKRLRMTRRGRNTRYRPCRFLNRKRKTGWSPPSVQSKIDSTMLWIDRFLSLVPRCQLTIEIAKFNLANVYAGDGNAGDTRLYIFARDNYTCQVCKLRNKKLRTHHILYKSKGGTDAVDNLITVCADCHNDENHKPGGVLYKWMQTHKAVKLYKEPAFMNFSQKRLRSKYIDAKFTYGSSTSASRQKLNLSKTHFNDAITISGIERIEENAPEHFYYKQFRKKKRSLHESIPRKGLSKKNTDAKRNNKNVKYRNGYYLNDEVTYNYRHGWVYGFSGGEKSKEFLVKDIGGNIMKMLERKNSLSINGKHLRLVRHNNNWQFSSSIQDVV
jgi:hypothetical protein